MSLVLVPERTQRGAARQAASAIARVHQTERKTNTDGAPRRAHPAKRPHANVAGKGAIAPRAKLAKVDQVAAAEAATFDREEEEEAEEAEEEEEEDDEEEEVDSDDSDVPEEDDDDDDEEDEDEEMEVYTRPKKSAAAAATSVKKKPVAASSTAASSVPVPAPRYLAPEQTLMDLIDTQRPGASAAADDHSQACMAAVSLALRNAGDAFDVNQRSSTHGRSFVQVLVRIYTEHGVRTRAMQPMREFTDLLTRLITRDLTRDTVRHRATADRRTLLETVCDANTYRRECSSSGRYENKHSSFTSLVLRLCVVHGADLMRSYDGFDGTVTWPLLCLARAVRRGVMCNHDFKHLLHVGGPRNLNLARVDCLGNTVLHYLLQQEGGRYGDDYLFKPLARQLVKALCMKANRTRLLESLDLFSTNHAGESLESLFAAFDDDDDDDDDTMRNTLVRAWYDACVPTIRTELQARMPNVMADIVLAYMVGEKPASDEKQAKLRQLHDQKEKDEDEDVVMMNVNGAKTPSTTKVKPDRVYAIDESSDSSDDEDD
jgi:hypothetical protein